MAYRTRLKYSDSMKSYIWDKYQQGDSICPIARSFDRPSSSIHGQIAQTGGIRPPQRTRRLGTLNLEEREVYPVSPSWTLYVVKPFWTNHLLV